MENKMIFKPGDRVFCHSPSYGKPFYGFLGMENLDRNGNRVEVASNHGGLNDPVMSDSLAFLVYRHKNGCECWHTPSDFRHIKKIKKAV